MILAEERFQAYLKVMQNKEPMNLHLMHPGFQAVFISTRLLLILMEILKYKPAGCLLNNLFGN
jgi:hypothetical protein